MSIIDAGEYQEMSLIGLRSSVSIIDAGEYQALHSRDGSSDVLRQCSRTKATR